MFVYLLLFFVLFFVGVDEIFRARYHFLIFFGSYAKEF